MDNSLIPRAFSPTDAKRRAEENAREAERRSSARNASSSTIGAGGKLTLEGGIDVTGEGVVRVVGTGYNAAGEPYEVTARLTSFENEGNYGTYESPALIFGSGIFGENENARVWSRSGNEVWIEGGVAGYGRGTVLVASDGVSMGYSSDDPALGTDLRGSSVSVTDEEINVKFRDTQAGTEAGLQFKTFEDPTGTLHVGHFDWRDTLFSRLRTKLGGKLWLESNSAAGEAAVYMDGAGNLDLQTTGDLTHNGAPIGAGGAGTWEDLDGKPTEFPPEAHTHAIGDITGLQTALDGKVKTGAIHAEFTLSATVATGGPVAAYGAMFAEDQTQRAGEVFATTPANGQIGLPAGDYDVFYAVDCGASMGSGAVIAIGVASNLKKYLSKDIVPNSWSTAETRGSLYLAAATNVVFGLAQFGGATRTAAVRVSIRKVK